MVYSSAMEETEYCRCAVADMRIVSGDIFCVGCGSPISTLGQQSSALPENTISVATHFLHKQLVKRTDFRLIRLLPGQRHDPIVCEISRLSLEDHPPYEAVSYTWGDQSMKEPIFTQAGPLQVTLNCKAALVDLRDRYQDRQLWIDAICINQTDNAEKNHQVPLISTIYSKADRVLIHLGSEHDADHHIRRFLQCLQNGTPFTSDKNQETATAFLSRPWFSRVWIQQEVAVAKTALIITGSNVLDWAYLNPGILHALGVQAVNDDGITPSILMQRDKKPFKDVVSLLNTARRCDSTDPRDNIYALLGLLQTPDDLKLTPNYDTPVADLYVEVTAQTIKNYNHLDILTDTWQQYQPGTTHEHSMALRKAVSEVIAFVTTKGVEALKESPQLARLVIEVQHASENMAHHWRKFDKFIDGITSATSEPDQLEDPEVQAFYRAFGVSITAEAREMQKYVLVSSPGTPIAVKAYGTTRYALYSKFSSCQIHMVDGTTSRFSALILEFPPEQRSLIRDALYITIFRDSIYLSSPWMMELLPERSQRYHRINTGYGHTISLPYWTPNFSDHRQLYSLANWRPKRESEASRPPVATVYAESIVRSTASQNQRLLQVKMLKLDSNKYLLSNNFGWDPLNPVQLDTLPTEVVNPNHVQFSKAFNESFSSMDYGKNVEGIWKFCAGRKVTLMEKSFAISAISAEPGDLACILYGACVPFMLRPIDEDGQRFQLLGECYVHGCKGPTFVDNYLELIGEYRQHFNATTADELSWETVYLE